MWIVKLTTPNVHVGSKSQGYRVLRFWNNDVLENTEGVAEAILSALRANPPP